MAILESRANGTKPLAKSTRRAKPLVLTISVVLISIELIFLAVWSIHEFGSISAGIAYLNGDRLLVDSNIVSFGDLRKGDYQTVELQLDNRADYSIGIRGVQGSQICSVLRRFPIAISPSGRAIIPIAVQPGVTGAIEERILLFTSDKRQPFIRVTVRGTVHQSVAPDEGMNHTSVCFSRSICRGSGASSDGIVSPRGGLAELGLYRFYAFTRQGEN
jgi:hypothetical protein